MKILFVLLIAIAVGAPATAGAQAGADAGGRPRRPDRWQVQLAGGQYLWDVRLLRESGDSLVVSQADSSVSVPLQDIQQLRLIRATEMRAGAGTREALGALSGANDEVFDLTVADAEERRRIVRQILSEHPQPGQPESRDGGQRKP
jgi:hypothetical protein